MREIHSTGDFLLDLLAGACGGISSARGRATGTHPQVGGRDRAQGRPRRLSWRVVSSMSHVSGQGLLGVVWVHWTPAEDPTVPPRHTCAAKSADPWVVARSACLRRLCGD
jgi:hypothetical protein